jgi:hypothetical protein
MKTIHLTDNAVRNHAELFPNHESKLQTTDPEFAALIDEVVPAANPAHAASAAPRPLKQP